MTVRLLDSFPRDKEDFLAICDQIKRARKTENEWADIESCDMFQIGNFCGGYDADESTFCFSYFMGDAEYWFQITLIEIDHVIQGRKNHLTLVKSDAVDISFHSEKNR